jgi:ABC-type bacteriocin/lantibiotic exporter with double-glycine peptidase domain
MWQYLQESIASYVESNLYHKKDFFTGRYSEAQHILNRHLSSLHAMQGAPSRLAEIFAVFGLLALIGIGHFSGNTHATEFVTLGAFLAAAYKIIPGIARILNISGQMKTYEFTVTGLVEGAKTAEEVVERPGEKIFELGVSGIYFRYDNVSIFEGLDLCLQKGAFLGIQGDSGKGKTTLLNILLGFIRPGKGEVLVNGAIRQQQELKTYWSRMAYVKQQPFIIHDSLLVNITLDEQHYDQRRLQKAIHLTGLPELIDKLPGGLAAVITENGRNISGGERQRIALARAIYKDPDVFLLDEPFSELDEASEERLLDAFREMAGEGKLIIMITHSVRSLDWCSRTLSLDRQPRVYTAR